MRIIGAAAVPPPLGFCADRVPGHLSKKQKNSTDLLIENRKKYTPPNGPRSSDSGRRRRSKSVWSSRLQK